MLLLVCLAVLLDASLACSDLISPTALAQINAVIESNPVAVFGVPKTGCLVQGVNRLENDGVCFKQVDIDMATWAYFKCKHPNEGVSETGREMHSYFYIGGEAGFVGNGFKLTSQVMPSATLSSKITAAGASLECKLELDVLPGKHSKLSSCQSRLAGGYLSLAEIDALIEENPVMLFGWTSCPCTGIANGRFTDKGTCFEMTTWDASSEPVMAFLNCLYGNQHHSFIFIGQVFIDNGFRFAPSAMGEPELDELFTGAQVSLDCGPKGEPFFQSFSHLISHNPAQKNYGVAVTDIDGDSHYEMVVAGFGVANLALKWDAGKGVFVDVAQGKPELQDASRSAIGVAACDINGDGYEELYILNTDQYSGTTQTSDRLLNYENATGAYADMFEDPANAGAANYVAGRSCACTDRDGDGKYGIFVSNYGGPMKLYEINQQNRLEDVAPSLGLDRVTGGRALVSAPIRSSYRMDIFANNENGCNFFWRNTGDGYVEEAEKLGIADCANTGRGTTVMDADADGFLDLVYGNWNGEHRMYVHGAQGFVDTAPPAMANPSRVRTVIAADFDNDGHQELFFNNIPGANRLFSRDDAGHWNEINIGDAMESSGHGTGGAVGDFDGDGVLELLISHGESAEEPLTYYRPRGAQGNNWLRIAPLTQFGGPARGAVVRLWLDTDSTPRIQAIDAGSGYLCQMEPVAHYGLGKRNAVAKIQVVWPDGAVRDVPNPAINTLHRVAYPQAGSEGAGNITAGGADDTGMNHPSKKTHPDPPASTDTNDNGSEADDVDNMILPDGSGSISQACVSHATVQALTLACLLLLVLGSV